MNKIGIIGCGWLGLPLAKKFIQKGFSVNGSTTSEEKITLLESTGIHPFLFSLPSNSKQLKECLKVDQLIINIPPGRKNPQVAKDFPKKIESILNYTSGKTNILFISSTSVYGDVSGEVDESLIPSPTTASGKVLLAVEERILGKVGGDQANWNNKNSVLRLSGLVGPGRIPGRFFAGKTNIPNGNAPVNLIHLEDCINCIIAIFEQKKWGTIYNLSSDKHPTKEKFYQKACRDAGFEIPSFQSNGDQK